MRARIRLRRLAWSALVAGGYLAAAKVVLVLLHGHAGLGAVWLPAGIATAAVLLRGYEMLPAVAAGSLLAGVVVPLPFSVLAVAAAGNTVAAGASRAMLRQLQFRTSLQRMRDVVGYVVVAGIVTTALSALVVTISLGAAGTITASAGVVTWRAWWLGAMAGNLLLGSAILVLANTQISRVRSQHGLEGVALTAVLAGVTALVLHQDTTLSDLVFPMLFVLALLYRQTGAAFGGFVVLAIAAAFSPIGHHFWIAGTHDGSVERVQLLIDIGSITAMLVAAAGAERHLAERALARLAESEQQLAYKATHDALTGLPNRTVFLDRLDHALARARRSGDKLSVLFLDLDDFKLINDSRGHDAGDLLLTALTPRLSAALRPGDTIARFGGDEFVVLCEDLASEEDAMSIAERISAACARPIRVNGYEHTTTVSIGVMVVDAGAATPSEVLREADAAMYRAKAAGKGRVEAFDEGMRARLLQRVGMESELRHALDDGELRLYYQPVVSLEDDEVVRLEALLRWQHPVRGVLEPAEFLPIAESSGLIMPIGEWVIGEACRQAAAWRDDDPTRRGIPVSVNLAQAQFVRSDIAAFVAAILARADLDASLLEIEITERVLDEDSTATERTLRELKSLGVRLVLDDFGTGYSSLTNLKRFTLDALKIDRSFVRDLDQDVETGAILEAVVNMADALDVDVSAEGVETSGQVSRLRERGCNFAQGYLFSRPVPPEDLPDLFERAPVSLPA